MPTGRTTAAKRALGLAWANPRAKNSRDQTLRSRPIEAQQLPGQGTRKIILELTRPALIMISCNARPKPNF